MNKFPKVIEITVQKNEFNVGDEVIIRVVGEDKEWLPYKNACAIIENVGFYYGGVIDTDAVETRRSNNWLYEVRLQDTGGIITVASGYEDIMYMEKLDVIGYIKEEE